MIHNKVDFSFKNGAQAVMISLSSFPPVTLNTCVIQ